MDSRKRLHDDAPLSSPERTQQFRRLNDRGRGRASPARPSDRPLPSYDARFMADLHQAGDLPADSVRFHYGPGPSGLAALADAAADMAQHKPSALLDAFRYAVSEQPHKLEHLAALLVVLSSKPPPPPTAATTISPTASQDHPPPSLSAFILHHLSSSLQHNISSLQWRSVRFHLLFFAILASLPRNLVSPSSLTSILHALASPLQDPNSNLACGHEFVRILTAVLFRFSPPVDDNSDDDSESLLPLISLLRKYADNRNLNISFLLAADDQANLQKIIDPTHSLVNALESNSLHRNQPPLFAHVETILNDARLDDSVYHTEISPIDLPDITFSSDLSSVPNPPITSHHDDIYLSTGYPDPVIYPYIFDDETVPSHTSPFGVLIRSLMSDIIDVYCVNRKECSRILFDLLHYLPRGIFNSNNQVENPDADDKNSDSSSSTWVLEHVIMDVVLGSMFALPKSHFKHVYYHSIITELCRISPSTVAPAMGKSLRRLYTSLSPEPLQSLPTISLDPAGIRRFADWFAVHLSNFSFQWKWRDWEKDVLSLPKNHPKVVFIKTVIELECRLSYYERIKSTLPSSFIQGGNDDEDEDGDTDNKAWILPNDAPTIQFKYYDETSDYHKQAMELIDQIRDKASIDQLKESIEELQANLSHSETFETTTAQKIAIECLLVVGSKSLSHLLNVFERYLGLFRWITPDDDTKELLLSCLLELWPSNSQMVNIVIDKLLQYRIIHPRNIINWLFKKIKENDKGSQSQLSWSNILVWDLLESALNRATMRAKALIEKRNSIQLKLDTMIKDKQEDDGMDENNNNDHHIYDNIEDERKETEQEKAKDELELVQKQIIPFLNEYETVFIDTIGHFHELIDDGKGYDKMNDDDGDLENWWLKGWFNNFSRVYAKDLSTHSNSISKLNLESSSHVSSVIQSAISFANS